MEQPILKTVKPMQYRVSLSLVLTHALLITVLTMTMVMSLPSLQG